MKAKDTVVSVDDLCRLICQEYRQITLDGKPCNGLDCEVCTHTKQAEISFKAGMREVVDYVSNHIIQAHEVYVGQPFTVCVPNCPLCKWQAFLKERGIDEPTN